jgi:hypothetical protein
MIMLRRRKRRSEPSDAEVRAVLVSAMAEVGPDPALIYAFQKTGVYVCEENERRFSKRELAGAIDQYHDALLLPRQ